MKVRELELKFERERPPEMKALRQLDDHYREKVRELEKEIRIKEHYIKDLRKIVADVRSELAEAQKNVRTISLVLVI